MRVQHVWFESTKNCQNAKHVRELKDLRETGLPEKRADSDVGDLHLSRAQHYDRMSFPGKIACPPLRMKAMQIREVAET